MAGPAAGIPLGIGTAAFGATMVGAAHASTGYGTSIREYRTFIAGGGVLLAAGLGTLIYSSIKLAKNKRPPQAKATPSRA